MATTLTLTYTRPELVRRRGLVFRRWIQASNVDPLFLVHAIRYYVAYPQHRPAIGIQAGYEDLAQAMTGLISFDRMS